MYIHGEVWFCYFKCCNSRSLGLAFLRDQDKFCSSLVHYTNKTKIHLEVTSSSSICRKESLKLVYKFTFIDLFFLDICLII